MPKTGILLPAKSSNIISDSLKEKHLSQDDFAEILGVTPKTLYNWLTGKHAIDLDKLQLIVLQIGIGIEDFLDGQEVPKEYYFPDGGDRWGGTNFQMWNSGGGWKSVCQTRQVIS